MSPQDHGCGLPQEAPGGACCAAPKAPRPQAGRRTVLSAVLLGVAASACCWLPLALAGLGLATGTLGARIAWIRPWALGALALLLIGVIAWWALKRFGSAPSQGACCAVAPRFPILAVILLGLSFIGASAAPRLLDRHPVGAVPPPSLPAGGTLLVLATPQFDCAPCAGNLPRTLAATPGVASIQMDFDRRQTRLVFRPDAAVDATLARWKRDLGFEGKVVARETLSSPEDRPR